MTPTNFQGKTGQDTSTPALAAHDERLQETGVSGLLLRSTFVAALGGLLFGFDTAVISGTTEALRELFGLGNFGLGFTVSSALIGTIVGAIAAGPPSDRFGRRATLFVIAILYFVSALGCGLAWDWYSLLFFRFLGGLGVGAASVVSPMYIAEISPARLRGRLVAITQFNIVIGVLLAFFSNYVIAQLDLGSAEWRWMLGVLAVPSLAFFCLLFLNPESPRWLVAKGRIDEARDVLNRLGADAGGVDVEIGKIKASLDVEHHTVDESLFDAKYRKPVLLAVLIATFNQLSGINALMYYAPQIFRMAGAGEDSALLQAVAVGGVNLVATMAAMLVIDHFGRRKLMLVGSIGYIVSLGATAWAFYHYGTEFTTTGSVLVLASLLVFIASHAFGQGARDLGLHQRDLPQPGEGTRPGPGELHALGDGGCHLLDVPDDRRGVGRPRVRLLRRDDGPATALGALRHARDEGRAARGNPGQAGNRVAYPGHHRGA